MIGDIKRFVNEHHTLMIVVIGVLVICFIYWFLCCKDMSSANKVKGGSLTQKVACTPMDKDTGMCRGYVDKNGNYHDCGLNTVVSIYYGLYDISKEMLTDPDYVENGRAVWVKCGIYQSNKPWADIVESEANVVHKQLTNRSKSFTIFIGSYSNLDFSKKTGHHKIYQQGAIWERILQIMLRNCIKNLGYVNKEENESIKKINCGEYSYQSDKSAIFTNPARFRALPVNISNFEKLMTSNRTINTIDVTFKDQYIKESCESEFIVVKLQNGETADKFLFKLFSLFKIILNQYAQSGWTFDKNIYNGYCVNGFDELEKPFNEFSVHPIGWGYTADGTYLALDNSQYSAPFLDFTNKKIFLSGQQHQKSGNANDGTNVGEDGNKNVLTKVNNLRIHMRDVHFEEMLDFLHGKKVGNREKNRKIGVYVFNNTYTIIAHFQSSTIIYLEFEDYESVLFFLNEYIAKNINTSEYKIWYYKNGSSKQNFIVSEEVLTKFKASLVNTIPPSSDSENNEFEFYNFFKNQTSVNISQKSIILTNPAISQNKRQKTMSQTNTPPPPIQPNIKSNFSIPLLKEDPNGIAEMKRMTRDDIMQMFLGEPIQLNLPPLPKRITPKRRNDKK